MERLKEESKTLFVFVGIFVLCFFMPTEWPRFSQSILEGLKLVKDYAQKHIITSLVPAFFLSGAVTTFIDKNAILKYLGARANQLLAYFIASISGGILTVCSCTIIPLFSSIYKMGAGIGPATTLLYAGPAINILAIVLTAKILGLQICIARIIGTFSFSFIIGLCMQLFWKNKHSSKDQPQRAKKSHSDNLSARQIIVLFLLLVGILIFPNLGKVESLEWISLFKFKITAIFALALNVTLILWLNVKVWKALFAIIAVALTLYFGHSMALAFSIGILAFTYMCLSTKGKSQGWFFSTWDFAKEMLPLLLLGIFVSGLLMGQPHTEGLIPSEQIEAVIGGNSFSANLIASTLGAFMYFATLTEIPILQGLIGAGMGKGPALALLLAGPAISLPNMLIVRKVMGTARTITFVALVILLSTFGGYLFGELFS